MARTATGADASPAESAAGLLLIASCLLASACASAPRTEVEDSFFRDLGEARPERLFAAVEENLVRERGFRLAREDESYARVYYETEWRRREPFPDEAEAGVVEARSRIAIRGQRASGGVYRTLLEGENEVRTDSIPSWRTAPVTSDFREWMAGIEADLRARLEASGAHRPLSREGRDR